jgi:hypothetical protein
MNFLKLIGREKTLFDLDINKNESLLSKIVGDSK